MIPSDGSKTRTRSFPFAVLLASGFSFLWALIEHIGKGLRVSPYQVVWTRYATQLVFLLLFFAPRDRRALVQTGHLYLQIMASLLMLGMPLCFILAIGRLAVPDIMVIFWAAPLMVAAASARLSKEPVSPTVWVIVVAASIGAMLVTGHHPSVLGIAWLFPIGMAACFAGYQLALRTLAVEPILPKLFHTALWVFLALTLALPFYWNMPSPAALVTMSTIGILGCIALFLLDRAIEITTPSLIAPAICTQPIWAELLDAHRPHRMSIVGILLIIGAIGAALTTKTAAGSRHAEVGGLQV